VALAWWGTVNRRRGAAVVLGTGAVAAAAGTGYVLQHAAVRRWHVGAEGLVATGRALPGDLRHHFVPTGDWGRIHVVEHGAGPPLVLVHGVTLGVGTWAPQFHRLARLHRVIALDLRGHGQSLAGTEGYSMQRLADDLLDVLDALDVTSSVLVGHSMGGMVAQLLAVGRADELRRHVSGLVLAATSAGPLVPGPARAVVGGLVAGGAVRGLRRAEHRGRGLFPTEDLGVWLTRVSFGAHPAPEDVELARSMIAAMSPNALSEILGPLLAFDVHRELSRIDLPTRVVVGSRDVLTPPRMARAMVSRIPAADLVLWPGCGHMVMLERPTALCDLLHGFSSEVRRVR